MELALVVYFIGVLPRVAATLGFVSIGMLVTMMVLTFILTLEQEFFDFVSKYKGFVTTYIIAMVLAGTVTTLIPQEKTMYMMAGAYATQQVYQSDEARKIGNKVSTLINKKLEQYINDIDMEEIQDKVIDKTVKTVSDKADKAVADAKKGEK